MHDYDDLEGLFRRHLSGFFAPPEHLHDTDGINAHMYLGHLLHEAAEDCADDGLRRRVAALVEDLHTDGDEACRELVHVSFFENMDSLTPSEIAVIRALVSPSMRNEMEQAFRLLGSDFD